MSKRDEAREQIAEILASFKQDRDCMYPKGCADCDGSWFCLKNCPVLQDYLNKILSLVAIVDHEAELPKVSVALEEVKKVYGAAGLEEIRVLFIQAFLDYMLKEGWVKEVSDV